MARKVIWPSCNLGQSWVGERRKKKVRQFQITFAPLKRGQEISFTSETKAGVRIGGVATTTVVQRVVFGV
jgi:hypothetical protein